jgi:serine phosphatase RsbU (regulator of sigma subunit)
VAARSAPTTEIVDQVIALVEQHEAGVERRDDLTMVVVRA